MPLLGKQADDPRHIANLSRNNKKHDWVMVSKELQERGNPAGMDYAFLGEALKVGQQLAYVGVPFDFEKTQQTGARALADQAEFALAQDVAKGTLSKLEKLKADLGGSPEIDRLIGELQLALASGNLQSIRELSDAALATIRSEVAARTSGDDGVDYRAAMIARHRDRYLNDAEYRAAIDTMMDDHVKDMKPVFEALAERDKTAQAHGVTTSVDDEVAQLEKELEETKKKGNLYAPEALEKERELLEKRLRQSEERVAEYIRMGRPDLAEKERETRASTIEPALQKVEETQKKADLLDVSEDKIGDNSKAFDVQSPEQSLTERTVAADKAQATPVATIIVANEPAPVASVVGSLAALGSDATVQPLTAETQSLGQMATVNLEKLPMGEMRLAVAEASEIQAQPVKTTIAPGALSVLA